MLMSTRTWPLPVSSSNRRSRSRSSSSLVAAGFKLAGLLMRADEGAFVFFPSIYWHFLPSAPISGTVSNDGLWDTRLVVSRDGRRLSYAGGAEHEARNARRPFVPMGVNTCQFLGDVDDRGGEQAPPPSSCKSIMMQRS